MPPFSGIGAEETGLKLGYQNLLVGQGKPGDILRNLLLEVFVSNRQDWASLVSTVRELFGYELQDPQYAELTDPFIRVEYRHPSSRATFDVASAGSGFHQVLTLLGFFYARPASVFLLDEPDAHLHVILQRQVYDRLRAAARQRHCQLVISTHSEVLIDDTSPEQVLSFYGRPHRLVIETHRDQVREALRRVSSFDVLAAEAGQNVLYVEDESDLKVLGELAAVVQHAMVRFFREPFVCPIHGRDAREAKAHFFGLKAIRPDIVGVLLLDGDNRSLPEREVAADGLTILRWKRYEIENYLLHPGALRRFVEGGQHDLFSDAKTAAVDEYMKSNMPPSAIEQPLVDSDYLLATPASKTLLPGILMNAKVHVPKKDYYQIAAAMRRHEVHPEVIEKLDAMANVLLPNVQERGAEQD